ncbi:hypothetical protein CTRI78_v008514 [Colletotrichum trifolii]|uniref:Uncharacterized protein n=1 Tax=Colletotrichum trifolii TaxID=5466 RepID=A0A4R8R0R3_COLTR|nr:hypothetical protein CTRI78_v008514 [Colletotrichum trifolii]
MSSSNRYQSYSSQQTASSYYTMASTTGGQSRNDLVAQTPMQSYATSTDASDRFYVTGQSSGRSAQTMTTQLGEWDQRWESASLHH